MTPARARTTAADARFAVRRPAAPGSRRRRAAIAGTAILVLGLVCGGIYWALHTPMFAVTRIETGSYRFTSPDALDSVLGRYLGRNLLGIGRDEVAGDMAALSWVRDLHIQRRLPGTLAVDFREWRPLAVIAQQDLAPAQRRGTWVLGENGRILEFPAELEVPALPTLVGYKPIATAEGSPEEREGPTAARAAESDTLLELFDALAAVGLETVAPVDFVVVRPEGYAIVLEGGQGRLQVGREDFRPRLERYLAARSHLEPGLDVDLRFTGQVTVRRPDLR